MQLGQTEVGLPQEPIEAPPRRKGIGKGVAALAYRVNTALGLGEIIMVEDSGNRDIPVACREGNKLQVELDVFGGDTATVEIWSNGQLRERFTSSPTGGEVGVAEC